MADAIRMIGDLHASLPSHAQLALVDRMGRIPFELLRNGSFDHTGLSVSNDLDVALHDADEQAASRRAERAHTRFPFCEARRDVLIRDEPDQMVLRTTAAGECRAGPGDRRQLDEIATVHQ